MPLFRFHRGNLFDSLETTVIVQNQGELMELLIPNFPNCTDFEIEINPYPSNGSCFDKRCGWYTQLVCLRIGKEPLSPIGMLSEPLRS